MKIWERGGTTPHINPVFLHNMPYDNALATILSMITFLLHNISLAIKCNTWIFHSLRILVSLYLWAMTWPKIPTRPGTKWDFGTTWMCVVSLTLHECVWSASHYMNVCGQPHTTTALPWGKCPDYQLNRRLDGPVENLLTLLGTSTTHSSIQATAYQPH